MTNIVIIGSGWASSSFLKNLKHDNKNKVTVISPNNFFSYTPLMIQSLFKDININYPLNQLHPLTHISDKVKSIDFQNQCLYLDTVSASRISYDYLILAQGSDLNTFNIPGVSQYCHSVKNIEDTWKIKDKLNTLSENSKIVVIGSSLTGSELVGYLIDQGKFKISVVDILSMPLMLFDKSISKSLMSLWSESSVNSFLGSTVSKVDAQKIYLSNNIEIPYNMAFWCGGVKNNLLTQRINSNLNHHNLKGIPVTNELRVLNTQNCYALGDCASTVYPKTAQVAYQQGKYLANQFNNQFQYPTPFKFYNKGQICYLGKGRSAYQNNYIQSEGKIIGYMNLIIHVYNCICTHQSWKVGKNLLGF